MTKEKNNSILGSMSNVLDSLGDLAEKGRQLKREVHAGEDSSPPEGDVLQPLAIETEKTESGWTLQLQTSDLSKAKMGVTAQDNLLLIKIARGQQVDYKDVELRSGFRIDAVSLDNASGQIKIDCS